MNRTAFLLLIQKDEAGSGVQLQLALHNHAYGKGLKRGQLSQLADPSEG
jgi:hypothetical protein